MCTSVKYCEMNMTIGKAGSLSVGVKEYECGMCKYIKKSRSHSLDLTPLI